MKLSKDNNGFGVIELVIILVVVIAIGAGGYYIWHKNHKSNNTVANTTTSSQSNTSSSSNTKEGSLYVTQWGVTFNYDNYNGQISLQYIMDPVPLVSGAILVSSSQLSSADPACSLSITQPVGFTSILRGKPSDTLPGNDGTTMTFQDLYNNGASSNGQRTNALLGGYIYDESSTYGRWPQNAQCYQANPTTVYKQKVGAITSIFN